MSFEGFAKNSIELELPNLPATAVPRESGLTCRTGKWFLWMQRTAAHGNNLSGRGASSGCSSLCMCVAFAAPVPSFFLLLFSAAAACLGTGKVRVGALDLLPVCECSSTSLPPVCCVPLPAVTRRRMHRILTRLQWLQTSQKIRQRYASHQWPSGSLWSQVQRGKG